MKDIDRYIAVDSSNNPTVAITRQWLKPLPHSSSQLKLRSCTSCNKPEAEPPNPRSQIQPGNENIEALPLIENGARSQLKLTGIRISVHFNGLELLDRELILCRVMNYICASMR